MKYLILLLFLLSSCCPSPEGFVSCMNYFNDPDNPDCGENMVEVRGNCYEKE